MIPQPPLRVMHVINGLELGGAETLLYRLATHRIPGVEQEVVCLGDPDWYSARLQEHGVTVHHLGINTALGTLARAGKLRQVFRERRPDVVQSWMYFANALGSLMASRTPVVWGIHNSSFDQVSLGSRLCALAGGAGGRRLASFVINCSQRSSELHAKLGYGAVPNAVIPNGYDPFEFRPDPEARAATRQALSLGEGDFVLGTIARWHPHKDIPNLLRAVKLAADEGVPLRCLLIGGGLGPNNDGLAAAISHAGCEQFVKPLGVRSDVQDLARTLDLHVLPSSSEAFPNVVAETMLSGTPNLVTDVGDSAAMVGETGWIVSPRNPEMMAQAIVKAFRERADHPRDWEKRRSASRAAIAERFTFERMADAYRDVWRRVAAQG